MPSRTLPPQSRRSAALATALLSAARCAPRAGGFRAPPGGPAAVARGHPPAWSQAGVDSSVLPPSHRGDGASEAEDASASAFAVRLPRRDALASLASAAIAAPPAAAALALLPWASAPPEARAAQTAGEAVRRSAANIPGYGQADVFYPPYFRGTWRATREIVSSDEAALAALAPVRVGYEVRFVSVDGDSPSEASGGRVVADRGYNERQYRGAVRAAAQGGGSAAAVVPPPVRDVRWDASNPNVLTLTYADGSTEEIKVTKRAAEVGPDGDTLSSSEYRRVTTSVGETGIPSIRGNRALTKWRRAGEGVVEGIEIVYADAVVGDPMGGPLMGVREQGPRLAPSRGFGWRSCEADSGIM